MLSFSNHEYNEKAKKYIEEAFLDSSKNITTITISNTSFFTLSPPLKRDVRGKNGISLYHKT